MNVKKLDCLLINPGDRVEIYQSLGLSGITSAEPPIWAGLIAQYLLTKGLSVEILDANAENLTPEETAKRVKDAHAILVGVVVYGHNPSASTQVMPSAGKVCSAIKRLTPKQPLLLVGGHVAALPARTLKEESADFVCTGEGPVTVLELIAYLKSSGHKDLSRIPGLMYRDNKSIAATPNAVNIMNLNAEIPGMPWHLLPMHLYKAHGWHTLGYPTRKPYASIYTTLGCPYKCEFCCIQAPFKAGEKALNLKPEINSYRYWSPELIVKEIKHLVEHYGIKHIKFADEMYFLNARHTNAISEGLIREGLGDWLNIWAYARVDTVKNDKMVDLAIKSGIHWFCLGIESASERVRDDIDKGYKQDDIFRCLEKSRTAGIYIIANYIFGMPEDNLATMTETLNLALGLNTEHANFYSAMAYPGSKLYNRAVLEQWRLPDSWIGYSQHSEETLPLSTKYLTGGQVLTFREYAHQKYFSNPAYQEMITKKFGAVAAQNVQKRLSKKLIRKHTEPILGLEEV